MSLPPIAPVAAVGTEVLGLAFTRTGDVSGLMSFVRTEPLGVSGDKIATLGWMDPSSGREVRSYLSYSVATYLAPHVAFHRQSRQMIVLEMAAPFRYTAVWADGSQPMKTGKVSFGTGADAGHVIFGAYPRDS